MCSSDLRGPLAEAVDLLGHEFGQRHETGENLGDVQVGRFGVALKRGVHGFDEGRLNLSPGEAIGGLGESGDVLGRGRKLALQEGALLAIRSAGAYGMSMSSNYNTRPRAAEVMVDGASAHVIRKRETVAELYANEMVLK